MAKLLYSLIALSACLVAVAVGYRHFGANDSSQPETTNRAKVRIFWSVESSQGVYGFTIYRGPSPDGPWSRVNPQPVLAADGGTTNIPHDYEYVDSDESIVLGKPFWYWLEAVNHDGIKQPVKWPPEMVIPKVRIHEQFPPLEK